MLLRRFTSAFTVCLLSLCCCRAGEDSAIAPVWPAIEPPVIDGGRDDLVWRQPGSRLAPFVAIRPDSKTRYESVATTAQAGYDDSFLYLLVRCGFTRALDAAKAVTGRTPIHAAEHLEIEFGPIPWLHRTLMIDVAGRVQTRIWHDDAWHARELPGIRTAVVRMENGWNAEVLIPRLLLFPRAVHDGARFCMRIVRIGPKIPREELDLAGNSGLLLGPRKIKSATGIVVDSEDRLRTANAGSLEMALRLVAGRMNGREKEPALAAAAALERNDEKTAAQLVAGIITRTTHEPDPRLIACLDTETSWFPAAAVASDRVRGLVAGQGVRTQDAGLAFCEWLDEQSLRFGEGGPVRDWQRPGPVARRLELISGLLVRMARAGGRDDAFLPLLRRYLAERAGVLTLLLSNRGATPCEPDACARIAAADSGLGCLAARPDLLRLAAGFQLQAHAMPGGAGYMPAGAELVALRCFKTLSEMFPARPALNGTRGVVKARKPDWAVNQVKHKPAALTAAHELLAYLAARVMPDAHLPCFGRSRLVVDEAALAEWGGQLFPDDPFLQRFLPEGLVAAPLAASAPAHSHAPEYGGLYVMRAPRAGVGCAVYAPGGLPPLDKWVAGFFGGIALCNRDQPLLLEPGNGLRTWTAALTVNGSAPLARTLPVAGLPLPHYWVTTPAWDFLGLAAFGTAVGKAGPGVQRTVFFAKGASPYLLVADTTGKCAKLTQSFVLAPSAGLGLATTGRYRLEASAFPVNSATVNRQEALHNAGQLLRIEYGPGCTGSAPAVFCLSGPGSKHEIAGVKVAANVKFFRVKTSGLFMRVGLSRKQADYLALANRYGVVAGGSDDNGLLELHGRFACLRLSPMGVTRVIGIAVKRIRFSRGVCWDFVLSEPADIFIRIKPDGTWSARLESIPARPVSLQVRVQPRGKGRPLKAFVNLETGRFVAFGLL